VLAADEMVDRLATVDMGRKLGGGCASFRDGELGLHLTQCRLGRGLAPYQVASSIHRAVWPQYTRAKIVWWGCAFFSGGAGSPSNTKSPGTRPTSIPSGVLVHPAVWPQQTLAENWGLCLFRGGGAGSHLTQCCLG